VLANTMKGTYPLSLYLLYNMCPIAPQNKGSN